MERLTFRREDRFLRALNHESVLTVAEAGSSREYGAFNLGTLIGLRGLASLIPLFAIWGVVAVLWWRMQRGVVDSPG